MMKKLLLFVVLLSLFSTSALALPDLFVNDVSYVHGDEDTTKLTITISNKEEAVFDGFLIDVAVHPSDEPEAPLHYEIYTDDNYDFYDKKSYTIVVARGHAVTVTVDHKNMIAEENEGDNTFFLEINTAPVVDAQADISVTVGETASFSASGSDSDGDALSFIGTGPLRDYFTSDGKFSWTPTSEDVGEHRFSYFVSDGKASDGDSVTITVNAADDGSDDTDGSDEGDGSDDSTDESDDPVEPGSREDYENQIEELEEEFESIEEDFEDLEEDLEDARDDDDERDIERYEDDIRDLEDDDLDALEDDIRDLKREIRDADFDEETEDDLIDRLKEIEDDIDNLKEDIADALGNDTSTTTSVSNSISRPASSNSGGSSGFNLDAVLNDLPPPQDTQEQGGWDSTRVFVWAGVGLLVLLALFVYLLALILRS